MGYVERCDVYLNNGQSFKLNCPKEDVLYYFKYCCKYAEFPQRRNRLKVIIMMDQIAAIEEVHCLDDFDDDELDYC